MSQIIINGKEYSSGDRICINNGNITISNSKIEGNFNGEIKIEGDVGSLICDRSVNVNGNVGTVSAKGSVNCDDVTGNVSAGGSVNCDDVGGSITAGGSVNCD